MTTHFIIIEINLNQEFLMEAIAIELSKYGKPLRWAITAVDQDRQKGTIEAVVTRTDDY